MLKMKEKTSVKHLNSFFVEIILVVLFFSIACAILVQVFGKAYSNHNDANYINSATIKGQSISETFASNGSVEKSISKVFGSDFPVDISDNTYTLNFDDDWKNTSKNIFYTIKITPSTESSSAGNLNIAKIEIYNKNELLFSTQASKYVPSEEGSNA